MKRKGWEKFQNAIKKIDPVLIFWIDLFIVIMPFRQLLYFLLPAHEFP